LKENDAKKKKEGELHKKVKESMKKEVKIGNPHRIQLKELKIKIDMKHIKE
jgi:hypothetical protein